MPQGADQNQLGLQYLMNLDVALGMEPMQQGHLTLSELNDVQELESMTPEQEIRQALHKVRSMLFANSVTKE